MTNAPPPSNGMSGKIFVIGFAVFCVVIAAGTLVATIVAQNGAPTDLIPPPEIGHELVPSGE